MKYPYFRMSTQEEAPKDLLGWFKHCIDRDISCCMVRTFCNYGERYELWREGKEFCSDGCNVPANSVAMEGVVVALYDPDGVFGYGRLV